MGDYNLLSSACYYWNGRDYGRLIAWPKYRLNAASAAGPSNAMASAKDQAKQYGIQLPWTFEHSQAWLLLELIAKAATAVVIIETDWQKHPAAGTPPDSTRSRRRRRHRMSQFKFHSDRSNDSTISPLAFGSVSHDSSHSLDRFYRFRTAHRSGVPRSIQRFNDPIYLPSLWQRFEKYYLQRDSECSDGFVVNCISYHLFLPFRYSGELRTIESSEPIHRWRALTLFAYYNFIILLIEFSLLWKELVMWNLT